jgi:hypothetical protein
MISVEATNEKLRSGLERAIDRLTKSYDLTSKGGSLIASCNFQGPRSGVYIKPRFEDSLVELKPRPTTRKKGKLIESTSNHIILELGKYTYHIHYHS